MNKHIGTRIVVVAVWGLLLAALVNSRPIDQYVSVIKHEAARVDRPVGADEGSLRKQIEAWSKTYEKAPINAYVDPIWKAVPGYNGKVIDVDATLKEMTSTGLRTPDQLVYREQPPAVSLEQLGSLPIYRGNPEKPAVSFMINVAWGNEYLEKMLDTLDKYQVKTTFFLDGSWVRRFPDLAKAIHARGHEIGNHAYSHPDMSQLGSDRIRQEIGKTQAVIEKTLGVRPTLFAPPSGSYSQTVVTIAHKEFGMKTILWTADTVDWRQPPVDVLIERVRRKLDNGVLVLMHPTAASAQGLERLLIMARQRGLKVTTVSDVLSSSRLDMR